MFEREGVRPADAPGCPPWWGRHDEEVAFIAALNAELVAEGYGEGESWSEGESEDWEEGWDGGEDEAAEGGPSGHDLLDAHRRDHDLLDPRRLDAGRLDAGRLESRRVDPRRLDPEPLDGDPLDPLRRLDAEAIAGMTPGAGLAFTLEQADVTSVDTYGVVEVVAAWFRVIGWAQAGMARAAAELHRRVLPYEVSPAVTHRVVRGRRSAGRTGAAAHEIAVRLGLTRQAAQAVIDDGLAFEEALAPVGEFLASGRIDLARARAFVDALGDSPAPTAVDVQQVVLPRAPSRTAPEVRRDLAAALIAVDPAEATARHARARDGRRVNHPSVLPDGMAALYAVMPAVDLAALDIALDAAARTAKAGGDPRTMDQLRADALAAVGHNALATGWIGRAPAPAPASVPLVAVPVGPVPAKPVPAGLVPGEPVPAGLVPGEPVPAGLVPGEPVPAERVVADAVPLEPVPAEPVHAEPLPAEVVPSDSLPAAVPPAEPLPAGPVSADSVREAPVPAGPVPAGPAVTTGGQCFRLGSIGGRPARIAVTVPLSVLMGADEEAEEAPLRRWDPGASAPLQPVRPGEVAVLEGYGPVTPDVARALAMGGVWQRLVTDPTSGTVLDVGRTRYTPPPEMADLVRARDRYCVRPGCGTRAQGCDLDHTTPFHLGGRTAVDNLGALCASDHALKTDGVYRVEQPEAGVFVFHLPSGHSYRRARDGSTTMLGRGTEDPRQDGDLDHNVDGPPSVDRGDVGPPPF